MTTAIIGSSDLDFKAEDLYRYVCNVLHPHAVDCIITTSGYGVAETARAVAAEKGIPIVVADSERDAISQCSMAVIFRTSRDCRWMGKFCARKNKLFHEYVISSSSQ